MAIQTLAKAVFDPTFTLFILAVALCFWRFRTKKAAILALVPFYLLTTSVMPFAFRALWEVEDTMDPAGHYAVVAPLGGAGSEARLLSSDLSQSRDEPALFFTTRIARVIAALEVLQDGRGEKLYYPEVAIRSFSETALVRRFCEARGLSPDRFVVYAPTARTTQEAAKLRETLEREGRLDAPMLLITSEMHMRRAYDMFVKQGLTPDRLSVNRHVSPLEAGDFLPSIDGLHDVAGMFYELVAYITYWVLDDL